ncbi:flavodoxin, partial [Brachyspira pilosicoli]|nr:flavodoxin [Brachyspira pilosicoli]
SRVYRSVSYIKDTCPDSKVLNYISIKRKDVSDLDDKINNWIRKIKVDISK